MKVLAKFLGRVNAYNEPPSLSYVTLKDVSTGKSEDATIFTEKLNEKGITTAGCEFEVIVMEDDAGKQIGTMNKLEPLEVSDKELAAISAEVDAKLSPPSEAEKERIKTLESRIAELEAMLPKKP